MGSIIENDINEIIENLGHEIYNFEKKNVLITGANGMLAQYIVNTLLYANQKILKSPCNLFLNIRTDNKQNKINANTFYIYGDISNKKIANKNSFHYIIHSASKAAPQIYTQQMVDTLNTNILGLYNILKSVDENTESVLLFSSGEIYGNPTKNMPLSEDYIGIVDHTNRRSCYVEGKRAAETIALNYFWEKKYPIKIARIFHTFGPGLNLNDGRVFSDFIKQGLSNSEIIIKGDSTIKRSLLYLSDATTIFLKILLSSKNGEIYNVANDKNIVTVEEMANIVSKIFIDKYKRDLKVIKKQSNNRYFNDAPHIVIPDISKFVKDFGFYPKVSIKEAFLRTIGNCVDTI